MCHHGDWKWRLKWRKEEKVREIRGMFLNVNMVVKECDEGKRGLIKAVRWRLTLVPHRHE